MKMFRVYRATPPEEYKNAGLANSGLSADFEGVVFDDGSVAVHWCTKFASHVIWPDWETLFAVHIDPHQNYGTRVEWSAGFTMHDEDLYGNAPEEEWHDGRQGPWPDER